MPGLLDVVDFSSSRAAKVSAETTMPTAESSQRMLGSEARAGMTLNNARAANKQDFFLCFITSQCPRKVGVEVRIAAGPQVPTGREGAQIVVGMLRRYEVVQAAIG